MSKPIGEHQDPEVDVIKVRQIPVRDSLPNRVDRGFWLSVIERLKLLDNDEALRIKWNSYAYTHVNSGAYWAARRLGVRVSVGRYEDCSYVQRLLEVDRKVVPKTVFGGKLKREEKGN